MARDIPGLLKIPVRGRSFEPGNRISRATEHQQEAEREEQEQPPDADADATELAAAGDFDGE